MTHSIWTTSLRGLRMVLALTLVFALSYAGVRALQWGHTKGLFDDTRPDIERIKDWQVSDNSVVYDRKGRKIGEFFERYQKFTPLQDIPRSLIQAVIAIEDKNFWDHRGLDPKAIMRAFWADVRTGRFRFRQGGSTITQQLVRNLILTRTKSWERKIREAILSMHLEQEVDKDRILELYLNSLYMGYGSYGVASAALRYFGKDISKIQPHEAALLAGLFQSPSRLNPHRFPKRAKRRQKQVITAMLRNGSIDKHTAQKLYHTPLVYQAYYAPHGTHLSYFVDYVRTLVPKALNMSPSEVNQAGLRIYTTLDSDLQHLAQKSIEDSEPLLNKAASDLSKQLAEGKKHQLQSAMVSVHARTGEIMAMIGGRDYKTSQFNRTLSAKRSPGSAFKPILFALALQEGHRWSDVVFVSPLTLGDAYRPQNSQSDYLTETTLLRAFYNSMNTPAVELGQRVGVAKLKDFAASLGIRSDMSQEYGLVLGGSAVSMLELAEVYGSFASGGLRKKAIALLRIEDRNGRLLYQASPPETRSERVIDERVAFVLTKGMQRVLSHGSGQRAADLASWTAGKTGTSNGARDNWFCGYSSDLVTLTWVGDDHYNPLGGRWSGGKLALPIWRTYMHSIQKAYGPAPEFLQPEGVISASIHPRYGHVTGHGLNTWFLQEYPPDDQNAELEHVRSRRHFRGVYAP